MYNFCVLVHYAAVEPMGELRWHNPLRNEELVNAALLSQQGPGGHSHSPALSTSIVTTRLVPGTTQHLKQSGIFTAYLEGASGKLLRGGVGG